VLPSQRAPGDQLTEWLSPYKFFFGFVIEKCFSNIDNTNVINGRRGLPPS
jgi:hypothetical protein